jgi:hypothetical protein
LIEIGKREAHEGYYEEKNEQERHVYIPELDATIICLGEAKPVHGGKC